MRPEAKLLAEAVGLQSGELLVDEPLRNHGKWRIGGPADLLVQPQSVEQVARLRQYLHDRAIAWVVIGEGSNLLFDDAGFRGVVIKIGRPLSAFGIQGRRVWAESGIAVPRLARAVGLAGLTGIEHTIGIPGTLGGLIIMNGGSQRKGIGDVVRWVEAMDRQGELHRKNRHECGFAYRRSVFQELDWIVVRTELELEPGDAVAIRQEMLAILRERRRKFPQRLPNCGSVFVSDPAMYGRFGPPGKVIEDTGLKGRTVGGAQVSHQHANFIVNTGQATAQDVRELIRQVRVAVHERIGMWMNCEVRYVTAEGSVRPVHELL